MIACEHDPRSHPVHSEWGEKLRGVAPQLLNELKPCLDEMPYENALLVERTEQRCSIEQQKWFPVHDRSYFTGRLTPDFIHSSNT